MILKPVFACLELFECGSEETVPKSEAGMKYWNLQTLYFIDIVIYDTAERPKARFCYVLI